MASTGGASPSTASTALRTLLDNWKPIAFLITSGSLVALAGHRQQEARKLTTAEQERQLAELAPFRIQGRQELWQELQDDDVKFIRETQELLRTKQRPIHSDFLVAATISYWTDDWRVERVHGVNSETCVLTSAICAERTAMLQLRLRGGYKNIRTVYITATANELITPGLLCREFMHEFGPPETRIVLFTGDFAPRVHPVTKKPTTQYQPLAGKISISQLGQMYPYPPLYHNVKRAALAPLAAAYASSMQPLDQVTLERSPFISIRGLKVTPGSVLGAQMAGTLLLPSYSASGATSPRGGSFSSPYKSVLFKTERGADDNSSSASDSSFSLSTPAEAAPADAGLKVLEDRIVALYRATRAVAANGPIALGPGDSDGSAPMGRSNDDLYPIHVAAGVLFSDGSIATGREDKCLEYGCSIDPVHKLVPFIETKARMPAAAATANAATAASLNTSLSLDGASGALSNTINDGSAMSPYVNQSGNAPGSAARSARKSYSAAAAAAAASSLVAPLPFANGTASCSCCGGASHPPSAIPPGSEQGQGYSAPSVVPILFLQVDQFGICRAPHASGRSWLTEYGFGEASMLVHAPPKELELQALKAAGLERAPQLTPRAAAAASGVVAAEPYSLILKRVTLRDLAPGAPKIVL